VSFEEKKRRPADAIVDAAFEAIMTPTLKRLLDGKAAVALVVMVPTAAWVSPFNSYWKRRFGDRWYVVARDGLLRSDHKSSIGNSAVAGVLADGKSVVGIAATPDVLPSALITSADHTVTVPAPNGDILRKAIESHLGRGIAKEVDPLFGAGLDINDLTAAFRPGSTVRRIFDRIARATERRNGSAGDDRLPPVETAFEYGDARLWAMDLTRDMADYRAGRLGWSQVSRAVVLHGETGTGKTLFAKMVAKHLGLPFLAFSIADLFAQSEGALGDVVQATNSMFAWAASASPCVTLLDELDALPDRATISARGRDWWLPVLTNFMIKLDGALASRDRYDGCVLIACTNYLNHIDSALLRPGRFEKAIEIRRPDLAGTINILTHHLPELREADREELGRLLEGSTGAELMSVARDARRIARRGERALRADDVRAVALPKEDIPPARLRRICVHEAAHAVGLLVLGCGTPRGIVVRTRDGAAARTMVTPDDVDLPTRGTFEARVIVTLCGRAAEALIVGEASVGSGLDRDSDIAISTQMIASLHASAGLGGELAFTSDQHHALKAVSRDKTLRRRVERHLVELEKEAARLVRRHRRSIIAVADALAEARYLSGDSIRRIFDEVRTPAGGNEKLQHANNKRIA
jgi:cell division protease FtsH